MYTIHWSVPITFWFKKGMSLSIFGAVFAGSSVCPICNTDNNHFLCFLYRLTQEHGRTIHQRFGRHYIPNPNDDKDNNDNDDKDNDNKDNSNKDNDNKDSDDRADDKAIKMMPIKTITF